MQYIIAICDDDKKELYEAEKLLVTPEKASSSDAPDSYLGIVMHHNGDVVACQKNL